MTILATGGNAVDAAIAANAAQGVVAPETCGIGGDLFALVHGPSLESPVALNATGRAGSNVDANAMRDAGLTEIPQRHPAAVSVPGCVDGWVTLHDRFGRIPLHTVLAPAVDLAANGFPASRELAASFSARAQELTGEDGARDMYPDSKPPLPGRRLTRPALAATLENIATEGRSAFYDGRVGAAIVQAVDNMFTRADLEANRPDWVAPLSVDLFGSTAWTVPPNSQGYISLLAMAILERIGLTEPADPLTWHLAIEAYRQAAGDRNAILADPDSMELPPAALLSEERIERLAAHVDPERATNSSPPDRASGGTAYMCVIDGEGLGVSLIQSNFHGIGSGLSVPEGGFLLHDRARGFTLEPGHANELRAGRRPLHTLSPTLWTDRNGLAMLLGTRGGHIQPQLVMQLSTAVAGHRIDPATAMAIPRWSTEVPHPGADTPTVLLEAGAPDSVVSSLRAKGHRVEVTNYPQSGWGPMSVITVGNDGLRTAAADPRVDTTNAGVL